MRVGTDQTYLSLKDQRDASLTVKEYPKVPDGSLAVGKVDASRCHRNALHTAPSETEILIDLKAVAFAKGADGIAEVKYSKGTGLLQNCWSILNGEAIAFTDHHGGESRG
jgi:hypothetical protein